MLTNRLRTMFTALGLAAAAGCTAETTRIDGTPIEQPDQGVGASCRLGPRWWQNYDHNKFHLGSAALAPSADGKLALVTPLFADQSEIFRIEDGSVVTTGPATWRSAVDRHWQWRLLPSSIEVGPNDWRPTLDIYPFGGDALSQRLVMPALPGAAHTQLAQFEITASGDMVVGLLCAYYQEDVPAQLVRFAMPSGKALPVINLGLTCARSSYAEGSRMVLTPQGSHAAIALASQTAMLAVNLKSGALTSADAAVPPRSEDESSWLWRSVVDLAPSPLGNEVAAVGHDGHVRRWSLPGLKPLGKPFRAAIVGAYNYTYQPNVVSPLGYSSDGKRLAVLSGANEVSIHNLVDGTLADRIDLPVSAEAQQAGWYAQSPLSFAFVNGDRGLLVSAELGRGLWRCGSEAASR